jgi:hypothetical protein
MRIIPRPKGGKGVIPIVFLSRTQKNALGQVQDRKVLLCKQIAPEVICSWDGKSGLLFLGVGFTFQLKKREALTL